MAVSASSLSCAALTYAGWSRLDLGLGNANVAGALLAMVALAVWLPVFWRKWRWWVSLPASLASTVLMCHTFSRGALVALIAGSISTLLALRLRWSRREVGLLAMGAIFLLACAGGFGLGQRVIHGASGEDRSITHRAEIYTRIPGMLAAAPSGWGQGQAALAYENWFQPIGAVPTYKHLISTHGTWMVERGLVFAWLYLSTWLGAAILCWPCAAKQQRWFAVIFGILMTFFVAGCFSHVGEDFRLWLIPGAGMFAVVVVRMAMKLSPYRPSLLTVPIAAAAVIAGAWGIGVWQNRALPVKKEGIGISVGHGVPGVWILQPDPAVVGRRYGHAVRQYLSRPTRQVPVIGVTFDGSHSKPFSGAVIVTGNASVEEVALLVAPRIIWLNPPPFSAELMPLLKPIAGKLTVVWGSLRRDASSRAWQDFIEGNPSVRLRWLSGTGLYVPDFLENVLVGEGEF